MVGLPVENLFLPIMRLSRDEVNPCNDVPGCCEPLTG
jgi:hypothetical protein